MQICFQKLACWKKTLRQVTVFELYGAVVKKVSFTFSRDVFLRSRVTGSCKNPEEWVCSVDRSFQFCFRAD